jgi:hypothetical protein
MFNPFGVAGADVFAATAFHAVLFTLKPFGLLHQSVPVGVAGANVFAATAFHAVLFMLKPFGLLHQSVPFGVVGLMRICCHRISCGVIHVEALWGFANKCCG